MLTRKELEEYKGVLGFNSWQVEKDYLQHILLLFLFQRTRRELVFKGGTALQKAFALNRFSIDLDFTSLGDRMEGVIGEVARDITNFGFSAHVAEIRRAEISDTVRVRIEGPLYDGSERTITGLRLEMSRRRDIVLEPAVKEIVPVYPDLRPYFVVMLALEEILAEKIRALMWRGDARDLYDLWFLIRKDVQVNIALANRKLSYYDLKFEKERFVERVADLKKGWNEKLRPIVSALPSFEKVEKDVKEALATSLKGS